MDSNFQYKKGMYHPRNQAEAFNIQHKSHILEPIPQQVQYSQIDSRYTPQSMLYAPNQPTYTRVQIPVDNRYTVQTENVVNQPVVRRQIIEPRIIEETRVLRPKDQYQSKTIIEQGYADEDDVEVTGQKQWQGYYSKHSQPKPPPLASKQKTSKTCCSPLILGLLGLLALAGLITAIALALKSPSISTPNTNQNSVQGIPSNHTVIDQTNKNTSINSTTRTITQKTSTSPTSSSQKISSTETIPSTSSTSTISSIPSTSTISTLPSTSTISSTSMPSTSFTKQKIAYSEKPNLQFPGIQPIAVDPIEVPATAFQTKARTTSFQIKPTQTTTIKRNDKVIIPQKTTPLTLHSHLRKKEKKNNFVNLRKSHK